MDLAAVLLRNRSRHVRDACLLRWDNAFLGSVAMFFRSQVRRSVHIDGGFRALRILSGMKLRLGVNLVINPSWVIYPQWRT
jgi:hypothetical protein